MSFWDIAKNLAKDYAKERGAKGLLEDAANLAKGAKEMFSDEGDDNDDVNDDFENEFDSLLDDEEYDKAESYVRNTYQREGIKPDSYYFYCLARARSQKADDEASIDLYNQARVLALNGRKTCPIGSDLWNAIEELIEEINEDIDGITRNLRNYDKFESDYDAHLNKSDYQGAIDSVKLSYKQYEWDIDGEYYYKIAHVLNIWGNTLNKPDKLQEALFHINQAIELEDDDEDLQEEKEEKKEIERCIAKQAELLSKPVATSSNSISDSENEYISEIKACLAYDGVITDRERRLLDKLRKSLGIPEQRAAELEAQANPNSLSDEEKDYAEEVRACLADDGTISDRERRLLDRLRKSLGISEERGAEIEQSIV